jgi:alcohol dehydrogenase class IV
MVLTHPFYCPTRSIEGHSSLTDAMASQAIRLLKDNLINVVVNPDALEARQAVQTASMLAGLTMGTTQTALAHSISYPFTSQFLVPHGLACSFALAEIARYNMEEDPQRLLPIADGLGCALESVPEELESWFDQLDIASYLLGYVSP